MKYDLLVFIGRFEPFHLGHQEVVQRALSLSKRVLVLVGSSGQARSLRNPFTYKERASLINHIYPDVITRPLHDHTYNDAAWIVEVQQRVKEVLLDGRGWQPNGVKDYKIGLIGCNKDHTSYYLKMFPDWDSEAVQYVTPLNATAMRNQLYTDTLPDRWNAAAVMPVETYDFLAEFRHSADYAKLRMAYDFIYDPETGYLKKYGKGPHITADSIVQVGGKILLIRRGKEYGHGLLAMPGGFVHVDKETFLDGALRELKEETRLKVPKPVLVGSIKGTFLADAVHRSERGRIVSQVHHIVLANDTSLPEVRGSDDADEAIWMDIADLRQAEFFEDHYFIIKKMLGIN